MIIDSTTFHIKPWHEKQWFDSFHKKWDNPKNVIHTLSGGIDSAFTLWYHAYYIKKNNLNTIINAYSDHSINSPKNFLKIWDFITVMEFPELTWGEHRVEFNTTQKKGIAQRRKKRLNLFKKELDMPINMREIDGTTMSPSIKEMKKLGMVGWKHRSIPTYIAPFTKVNKKKIAELLIKYDINELFYFADGCIYPSKDNKPCKECWWCKEKYWAFGMYDYGII